MWPLGGLAYVEVPHTPRANFITTAAGPAVNLFLLRRLRLACSWWSTARRSSRTGGGRFGYPRPRRSPRATSCCTTWERRRQECSPYSWAVAARPAVLGQLGPVPVQHRPGRLSAGRRPDAAVRPVAARRLPPGDAGGRLRRLHRHAWSSASTPCGSNETARRCAWRLFIFCRLQAPVDDPGDGRRGRRCFGYDFSQGYTSLERDAAAAAARPPASSWWQRWLQQRTRQARSSASRNSARPRSAAWTSCWKRSQREGMAALTDEERRFLKRVSDRYRNRQ